jgi:hypothetical protein
MPLSREPIFLRMAIWLWGLERLYLVPGGVAVDRGFEPQSDMELFFAEILKIQGTAVLLYRWIHYRCRVAANDARTGSKGFYSGIGAHVTLSYSSNVRYCSTFLPCLFLSRPRLSFRSHTAQPQDTRKIIIDSLHRVNYFFFPSRESIIRKSLIMRRESWSCPDLYALLFPPSRNDRG